jgi:ribosomal protein S18 acetylase RimI-like enzyme
MSDLLLPVREAPGIPGLIFRNFRGPEDFPGMVEVYNACRPVDGYDWPTSAEDLARTFAHLEHCDPHQDMIFAEVEGQTVGYGRGSWYREPDGTTVHDLTGHVAPAWRRRGLGRAILRWTEERQRQVAGEETEAAPHLFQVGTLDSEQGMAELLTGEGYTVVRRWYQMTRPLDDEIPEAPLPAGLEVRPVTPDQYRQIWEADVEAFRSSWGFAEPSADDFAEWLEDPVVMVPELWQIAWDGDQVAGQVRSFINHTENAEHGRRRGYTEFISVGRPWRRRGLAQALIVRSLRILQEQGMAEAALNVDTENVSGALRLYERCGFRPTKSGSVYRQPFRGED